ncbi:MAG: type II toxin-antitoxin system prevent-host-death family antitoxin [Polyangiaceae bacterium]|nr:type II toxin-antitoxin system prevent-host-death family antitoxin [Polyangiaceae bacterium]
MLKLNVHEAKAQLSRVLERVEKGETVILCRRNVPVAEIHRIVPASSTPREVGWAREAWAGWTLPDSFFEPLPDALLDAFEGRGG